MKRIFLVTTAVALFTAPVLAETKWFVGANLGYAEPILSDELDDQIDDKLWDDDSGTLAVSLTGGMRFGEFDKIYNGGVSVTLSYMPDLMRLSDGDMNPYYMDAELDFTTLYISYDNYIRLSGDFKYRTDFIASVGLGFGWLDETLDVNGYGRESYSDEGMLLVLKFGFGGETKFLGLGWNATMNIMMLNAKDDADLQGNIGFNVGLTYTF